MATLVLSVAGNALAPGVGGVLGGIVGSLIDSKLLAGHQKNGRIDDLQLGSATEGAPKNYCYGSAVRVPGQLIWCPLAIEVQPSGGKGGSPSGSQVTYAQDLAVEVAGHAVSSIEKIWANGTVIYNNNPDVNYSDTHVSAAIFAVYQYSWTLETNVLTGYYLDLNSTSAGPDLSALVSGIDVTVGGFTTTATIDNGTWRVMSSSRNNGTGTSTCRLNVGAVVPVAKAAGDTVTILQHLPKFSTKIMDGITFYLGSNTQVPSALMESYLGTGNVSAYRKGSRFEINRLNLTSFGNRVPEFSCLVKSVPSATVGSEITRMFGECGGPASALLDASACTDPLTGYAISGPTSGVDRITPLLVAFDILPQERDGSIYFFPRANAVTTLVVGNDLAAHDYGSDSPRVVEITDGDSSELPSQVSVTYSNPGADYQSGSQIERRGSYPNNVINTLDLRAVVMSDSNARTIARRTLWTMIANRQKIKAYLPPSYMANIEGDRLNVPVGSDLVPMLIQQRSRGANWMLELDGVVEDAATLTWPAAATEGSSVNTGQIYILSEMRLEVMDLPCLQDAQLALAGFYFGISLWDINETFAGAGLLESVNSGSSFGLIETVVTECTMGYATTVLGTAVPYYWDRKATVTVQLNQGTLASVTEDDCLNGQNWFLIGSEIVGAVSCVLSAPNTYVLSTLLRGCRGTERQVGTHIAGERVVHLNSLGMQFHQGGLELVNTTRQYKAVPAGGLAANYAAQSSTLLGGTLRPLSPCNVTGSRLLGPATNDLTINWFRRTRTPSFRVFSGLIAPLNETTESYEIDILNDAETAVLRTIAITGQTSVVYTAAQQTTDYGGTHANVHMKLYQMSSVVGRGAYEKVIL